MNKTQHRERREDRDRVSARPSRLMLSPALRLLLGVTGLAVALVIIAAVLPSSRSPRVLVRTMSYAVQIVPLDSTFELVAAARPRFSVELSRDSRGALEMIPFDGIRIDSLLPEASTGLLVLDDTIPGRVLRRLTVTRWCKLTIERFATEPALARTTSPWIQVVIERVPVPTDEAPACEVVSEVIYDTNSMLPERQPFSIPQHSSRAAIFKPRAPLQLKHIPVSGLSFDTKESGEPESSILRGTIVLADYDGPAGSSIFEASARDAQLGDVISFGRLSGEIVELTVGDTIAMVYSGHASRPVVGGKKLRPSLLMQLANTEWIRLSAAIVFSVLALALAYLQIARHER